MLDDKWLVGSPCFRPLFVKKSPPSEYVSCLIDESSKRWNRTILEELFDEETVRSIKRIPISNSSSEDSQYWRYTRDGAYSVKSGYKCAFRLRDEYTRLPSSSSLGRTWWDDLWNSPAQLKVKHCLWAAANGCLPSKSALRSRKLDIDPVCVLCKGEERGLIHIFKGCLKAESMWKELNLRVDKIGGDECLQWFQEVFSVLTVMERVVFCHGVWVLWGEYTGMGHGKEGMPVKVLVSIINDFVGRDRKGMKQRKAGEEVLSVRQWKPPPVDRVKINVDVAVPAELDHCTMGFVCRDEKGKVLLSGAAPIGSCLSVLHAELTGILQALRFSLEAGLLRIDLAADNISAIKAVNGEVVHKDSMGCVIDDIRDLCKLR